ncbi:MAG: type I-E CRISPR-associated protein Cas7/Cse4/CasC [Gammaproteobacteria bacterium]|nr:type I-E CRISPR-associated protein Cas7/Cse4/CasC [Gammaproteobacteria bacterium]
MIIEQHIIRSVVPANLNRDDRGAPKQATFGGHRRSRVSSQALKRAARRAFTEYGLDSENLGVRTRLVGVEVAKRLGQRNPEEAANAAQRALENLDVSTDSGTGGKSAYLLFLGADALDEFAAAIDEHWDELSSAKKLKKATVKSLTSESLFGGSPKADIAMFGRMIADLPAHNVDAAVQVAHAISTHAVAGEFDWFTAVDDLQPENEPGAGMMGTVEFNSACLYQYSNVDVTQLLANLDKDVDLARQSLAAFLRAMALELPTGKQNSMAAHNPPSLVLHTARRRGQWNLANAFENPVRAGRGGIVEESQRRLLNYYHRLSGLFPAQVPQAAWFLSDLDDAEFGDPDPARQSNLDELVDLAVEEAFNG